MKPTPLAPNSEPTPRQKWLRRLRWLGYDELTALLALIIAVPFIIGRLIKIKSDAGAFEQTQAANLFAVTLEATANAPLTQTFATIVPIDLPKIMPGYGPLPAVVGVENQTGKWNAVGQTRTIRLADGTAARETLTSYDAPHHFAYTVSDVTGALRFLAREAKGQWHFSETADGETRIRWRYAFTPQSVLAAPALWLVVQLLWRGTMKQALRECARQARS